MMSTEEAIATLARDPAQAEHLRDGYLLRTPREDAEAFAASAEFAATRRLLAGRIEGAVVVDVGAGRGAASLAFARAGARRVLAVEPSPGEALGRGAIAALGAGPALRIVDGWGEALPLPAAEADVVYCRQTLHHARDLGRFVAECARVLKPGGVLLAVREHVADDEAQRAEFLADHAVHRMAGGENAYPAATYAGAMRAAGLRVRRVLGPFDSVICAYPGVRSEAALAEVPRAWLRNRFGPRLGAWLARAPGAKACVIARLNRWPQPGRLYSFLAEKPR